MARKVNLQFNRKSKWYYCNKGFKYAGLYIRKNSFFKEQSQFNNFISCSAYLVNKKGILSLKPIAVLLHKECFGYTDNHLLVTVKNDYELFKHGLIDYD